MLYSFENKSDGESPAWTVQGSDGNLYGAASGGGDSQLGTIFKIGFSPALPAPVQLSLSSTEVSPNTAVTLAWKVLNAFSDTAQQCFAFLPNTTAGAGTWTGKQTGTLSNGIYSGSAIITPTAAGAYTYAMTCGGVKSGPATLTVTEAVSFNDNDRHRFAKSRVPWAECDDFPMVKKSSGSGTPTGSVVFSADSETLATVALNKSGVASLKASSSGYAAGVIDHRNVLRDSDDAGSVSTAYNETLKNPAATDKNRGKPKPVDAARQLHIGRDFNKQQWNSCRDCHVLRG